MKKLLLALALLLLPTSAFAAIAAPWTATSTDLGYITPSKINGNNPWIVVSGTATSTFAGTVRATCFSINGTSCLTSSAGSSGTISTSSSETAGYFPKWTSTSGTPALLGGTSALFQSGSNVGIGTSSPTFLLSVGHAAGTTDGNALFSGEVYANNFYDTNAAGSSCIGDNAGLLENGNCVSSVKQTYGTAQTGALIFATSTTAISNDWGITNSGGTFTFNLPTATASIRGLLAGADFTTFNTKQAPGFQISTSSISISGVAYFSGTTPTQLSSVATSSVTYGLGLTTGGTFGALVGGSAPTLNIATSSLYTGTTGQFPYFSGTNTITATSSLFINTGGEVQTIATQPATSTAITLNWTSTPNQVEYQIGTAGVTITLINATTSAEWGSRKLVWVCNPASTAGTLTWAGVEWIGTAPVQTTTASQCDAYSLDVTEATSTSAFKVAGTAGTGFQ